MSDSRSYVLTVPLISCNHCKMAIESAVGNLSGVAEVNVAVAEKTVAVSFDADQVALAAIEAAIEEEGYEIAEAREISV